MKLVERTLTDFLDVLSSNAPAPGGGSVSALSGANAVSLVMMVSSLTINKKKFKALDEETKKHYQETIALFLDAKAKFEQYIDEDTQAFNQVMAAFKLPKETEEEIRIRNNEIQKATVASIKTPIKVSALALDLIRKMDTIIKYSNRNTVSDQGVAVLLLHAACIGGILNVKINLPGLSEKNLVNEYKHVIMDMTNEINEIKDKLIEEVNYLLD